jgi:hypothetical protein
MEVNPRNGTFIYKIKRIVHLDVLIILITMCTNHLSFTKLFVNKKCGSYLKKTYESSPYRTFKASTASRGVLQQMQHRIAGHLAMGTLTKGGLGWVNEYSPPLLTKNKQTIRIYWDLVVFQCFMNTHEWDTGPLFTHINTHFWILNHV